VSTWRPGGTPFCWQPKAALERIEQGLEREQAASAKLVYLALTRIANNEGSDTFMKPITYIAALASVSAKTVERRLPDLEKLGLIIVDRCEKFRTQHCYHVATLSRNVKTHSPDVQTQSPNVQTASGVVLGSSPVCLNRELEKERRDPKSGMDFGTLKKEIALE
jgi:hypothetical protein